MFGDSLRDARTNAGLSVAHFAELAGTSRSAIADYEAGRKIPRIDTADRLMADFGLALVPVDLPSPQLVRLDDDILAPLRAWLPDRERVIQFAVRERATLVEADALAERLDLSWGQIKTFIAGTTVDGDDLSVWRLRELSESVIGVLRKLQRGIEPQLSAIARESLIVANPSLDIPRRAIDFLVRATQHGADPAFIRHLTGGYLAHHGYPWLWVPPKLGAEYRRALVACMRQGEGNLMAQVLIASIGKVD